jgi:RNA polymerase sigma factor (TIGR02999 family)
MPLRSVGSQFPGSRAGMLLAVECGVKSPVIEERTVLSDADRQRITAILQNEEGSTVGDELLPLVYNELRRLASSKMVNLPPGQTLQPTELVHEAYLKLFGEADLSFENRGHFFGAAANAMRQILVNRAKRKKTEFSQAMRNRLELDDVPTVEPSTGLLLALDKSLKKLEMLDARLGKVVMLRCFAGLTIQDTANSLDVSPSTVKRDWEFARTWLQRDMSK